MADVFPPVIRQSPGRTAEQTGWLVLLQYDSISIQIDFQRIPFLNIQSPAKLNRKNDSAQFVNFTHNSGCLHDNRFPSSFIR